MLTYLPVGWWLFLKRNIPQIGFNWGLVTTGVICSVVLLGLGNWFLNTVYAEIQVRMQPGKPAREWRLKWSAGLYCALWLLFLVAFGATGVYRHTVWLMNDEHPWYEKRAFSYSQLFYADSAVRQILIDQDEDLEGTRKAVLAGPKYYGGTNALCEDYNVILYGDTSNKVAAWAIIPRDPMLLAKSNFAVTVPEGGMSVKPLSQFPQLILELDAKYPVQASH
jgi:hypothetical protein